MGFGEGTIIAAGDLRYISDLKMDRTYKHSYDLKESAYTKLLTHIGNYNLTDTWRYTHPVPKDYTFYSPRHKTHTRIDLTLTS